MLDGADYLLLYQDPSDNFDTHTRYQILARPLWLACRGNIVAFRILSLGVATLACWLFWRAVRRVLLPSRSMALTWWPFWLATMAGITWVPVALTYNSLSTLLVMIGLAALLAGCRLATEARLTRLNGLGLASGLVAAAVGLYLVKPPAAAAFLASCVFVICCYPFLAGGARRLLLSIGALGLAAVVAAALVLLVHSGPGQDRTVAFSGLFISQAWVRETTLRYASEIRQLLPALGLDLLWTAVPTVAVCCAVLLRGADANANRLASAGLLLVLACALGAVVERRLWDGSFASAVSGEAARFYLMLGCSLVPIWIVSWLCGPRPASDGRLQQCAWIVVLLTLPLVCSFGSTNTPYVSALHSTVFWVAGLLLAAGQIGMNLGVPWFTSGVAILLSLCAAGQIFSGQFLRPYMYQPSIWRQTEAVAIGYPSTTLRVDPALARFIRDVRATLVENGYSPGDDVFGFFNLPGVIFAVGAKEPGAPWYYGTWYHQDDTDGGKLRRVPLERRKRAWIVTQADVRPFRSHFLECGIDFPDGYTMIGRTINPTTGLEIGIWKPRARN